MSKFCMYCGSEMDDNASICPSCGSNQEPVEDMNTAGATVVPTGSSGNVIETVKSLPKNIKVIIIAGAAVIVLVIVLVLTLIFSGGGKTAPIENMIKGLETGKGKYIYECYPEFVLQQEFRTGKKEKILDKLNDYTESAFDSLENKFGEDFDISYTIKDEEALDSSDLKKVEKNIKREYDERVKVKAGYKLKVKLKIKGEDDHNNQTATFYVYKIGGNWCFIDDDAMDSMGNLNSKSSKYYDDDDYDDYDDDDDF